MERKSSYQVLKKKNEELSKRINDLHGEIYLLIREPESYGAAEIKMKYEIGYRLDDEWNVGSGWACHDTVGLWGYIENQTPSLLGKLKIRIKRLKPSWL